jgi:hypothetical protein
MFILSIILSITEHQFDNRSYELGIVKSEYITQMMKKKYKMITKQRTILSVNKMIKLAFQFQLQKHTK